MNRKQRLWISLLFVLMPCAASKGMSFGVENDPEEEKELQQALEECNKIDVGDIEREIKESEKLEQKEIEQDKSNAIKWRNRLLTSADRSVGLYTRDLIETPKIVGDLAADVLMYRNLLKRRIESLEKCIMADLDGHIKILREAAKVEEVVDDKWEEIEPALQQLTSKRILLREELAPLRNFIATKHALIGFNPFTRDTILPVFLRFIWQKASDAVVGAYIEDDTLEPGGMSAYKVNKKGEYEVCRDAAGNKQVPLGITTFARFFLQPAEFFSRLWREGYAFTVLDAARSGLGYIVDKIRKKDFTKSKLPEIEANLKEAVRELFQATSRSLGRTPESIAWMKKIDTTGMQKFLGMPDWWFSPEVKVAQEFAAMGLAAQIFDQVNTADWQEYVLTNRDKLLDILENYKQALNSFDKGDEEVIHWESKLKKFIKKGHTPPSWLPGSLLGRWWIAMKKGQIKSSIYASYPITALVAWNGFKAAHFLYKSLSAAA